MAKHKLAVIVFTDIVRYSAMMSRDEDAALNLITTCKEIHKSRVREYNGRYLKEIGDGTLCSFETASDAVKAAIAIQEAEEQLTSFKQHSRMTNGQYLERFDSLVEGVSRPVIDNWQPCEQPALRGKNLDKSCEGSRDSD